MIPEKTIEQKNKQFSKISGNFGLPSKDFDLISDIENEFQSRDLGLVISNPKYNSVYKPKRIGKIQQLKFNTRLSQFETHSFDLNVNNNDISGSQFSLNQPIKETSIKSQKQKE